MKNLKLTLIVLMFIYPFTYIYSQNTQEPTYDIEFIQAEFKKKRRKTEIILFFKYEKEEDELALMSTKLTYNLNDGNGDVIEILEESKHSIIVHGTINIKEKNPLLYLRLRNKVDFDIDNELFILEFRLKNITKKYIDKMTFKYGLWEPSKVDPESRPDVRIETEYQIEIEDKSSS